MTGKENNSNFSKCHRILKKENNIDSKCQGIPRLQIMDDENVKATLSGWRMDRKKDFFSCTVTQA